MDFKGTMGLGKGYSAKRLLNSNDMSHADAEHIGIGVGKVI